MTIYVRKVDQSRQTVLVPIVGITPNGKDHRQKVCAITVQTGSANAIVHQKEVQMTEFNRACRYRPKNALRTARKAAKKATARLNRREGKRHLEDAKISKLNGRDIM